MELAAALTELAYAKDWTPASRVWYASRLGAFVAWARDHGVTELESLTAPLIRRYVDARRTTPMRTGKPLDSHTLHGHVRAIRALLHWAVAEGLIDANVPVTVLMSRWLASRHEKGYGGWGTEARREIGLNLVLRA